MTRAIAQPRWAVSFADLCLLLLGFFVILHARSGDLRAAAGVRAAFGGAGGQDVRSYPAAALFEPGEALFRSGAERTFVELGQRLAADKGHAQVDSIGTDPAAARFDAWELSAARAAAVARAIRSGGLDEHRIEVAIPPSGGGQAKAQTISVVEG